MDMERDIIIYDLTCKNKKDKKKIYNLIFKRIELKIRRILVHLINFQLNMFNNNCHNIIDSYIKLNFLNYILYFFNSFLKILIITVIPLYSSLFQTMR